MAIFSEELTGSFKQWMDTVRTRGFFDPPKESRGPSLKKTSQLRLENSARGSEKGKRMGHKKIAAEPGSFALERLLIFVLIIILVAVLYYLNSLTTSI